MPTPLPPKKPVSAVQAELDAFEAKKLSTQPTPAPRPPAVKYIAEHTVAAGETLSHISLKYYGSAVKDKYMQIYEANKAVIGSNPNLIKPGQVLKIPELE